MALLSRYQFSAGKGIFYVCETITTQLPDPSVFYLIHYLQW